MARDEERAARVRAIIDRWCIDAEVIYGNVPGRDDITQLVTALLTVMAGEAVTMTLPVTIDHAVPPNTLAVRGGNGQVVVVTGLMTEDR